MGQMGFVQDVQRRAGWGYGWAVLSTLLGTLGLAPLRNLIDLANVALLYVLAVVVMAVSFGRGPAVLTALGSALAFAYVFVPPHLSLEIHDVQSLLVALIMLIVALIVGHLTSRLKQHADAAQRRAGRSRALYQLAKELAGMQKPAEVQAAATQFFQITLTAREVRLIDPETLPDSSCPARPALIRQCMERRQLLTRPTESGWFYAVLPLVAASGVQGVLGVELMAARLDSDEAVEYLETAASVLAVALERSRYAAMAQETELRHAAEALRSSILAALSHDLRTPLTALVGMADTVVLDKLAPEKQRPMLEAIRNQALSISRQMTNLLDMARLSAGKLQLHADWQPIEEVLGATLQQVAAQWPQRRLELDLAPGLPPVNIDAVLMERVFWNLLDNAIKYAPLEEKIEISVRGREAQLEICICDRGPGVPAALAAQIFESFQRGHGESSIPGVGLGLSIARTIVAAHGGEIVYLPREGGGSCFHVRLPLGETPDFAPLEP
jgi:two-component system sensor histidine kinase KdpD